jgi:FtsX-like permease family/MacB-like periplasmic core domain
VRTRERINAAIRNLRRRPLRNGLALVGIVLATATLVILLALSDAARHEVLGGLEARPMLTTIQVVPAAPRGGVAPRPLNLDAVREISRVAGVKEVVPVIVVPVVLIVESRQPAGTVSGLSPTNVPYSLRAGRTPVLDESNTIVLTPGGLRSLGEREDEVIGRAAQLELRRADSTAAHRAIDVRIVGITDAELPGLAIVPFALAEDALSWISTGETTAARDVRLAQQAAAALLFGGNLAGADLGQSKYSSLWVITSSIENVRGVKGSVEALGYGAFSQAAAVELVEDLFRAVNALLIAVSVAALVLAGLGVVSALLTSVSERTVEIGVMKALGATDSSIVGVIVTEAAVLGVAGGLIGVVVGWLGAVTAASVGRIAAGTTTLALSPAPDLPLVTLALTSALVLAVLAAWLPARRAARLPPAEALRSE